MHRFLPRVAPAGSQRTRSEPHVGGHQRDPGCGRRQTQPSPLPPTGEGDGGATEAWLDGSEGELLHRIVAVGLSDDLEESDDQQRSLHDQTGIPLDVPRVREVVVDAMRVERECGEAEEQRLSEGDLPPELRFALRSSTRVSLAPLGAGGVSLACRGGSVDEVLLLECERPSFRAVGELQGDECKRPTAPLLAHHIADPSRPSDRDADRKR